MAQYDALIRFRKWELDEERKKLTTLLDQRDGLMGQMHAMIEALQASKTGVDPSILALTLGGYMEGMRTRQYELEAELEGLNKDIETQQEAVSYAFQELKTIEIAAEKQAKEAAKKQAQKAQNEIDESSMQLYLRKKAKEEGL